MPREMILNSRRYVLSNSNIAIDGPAGAGKSTIAKAVARELGLIYVDTGAMYRAIGLYFLNKGICAEETEKILAALADIDVSIRYEDGVQKVILNGEDVTSNLRREEVGNMASATSVIPEVRTKLVDLQRTLAKKADVIMDGRDIGTVVLPDARLKIFLTASVDTRAKRRFEELKKKGENPDYEAIKKDIEERDYRDTHRAASPLKKADDAIALDTSDMGIEEVVAEVLRLYNEKFKIRIAKSAGFCFGVKRAVRKLEKEIYKDEKPIYTLGPIIHNEYVVNEFAVKGVSIIDSADHASEIKEGVIVIRSHGVSRETFDKLNAFGCQVIDATCPFVTRIHEIVRDESRKGRKIVIIGDPMHPEVIGTMGWVEGDCRVVSNADEAAGLDYPEGTPVCVVAQTTFNLGKFNEFVEIIEKLGYDCIVLNTICSSTGERQREARSLSKRADLMLVIGSKSSSNTGKLYEVCKEQCVNTYHIQSLDDLSPIDIKSDSCVGITAGASTPNNLIQEVSKNVRRKKF